MDISNLITQTADPPISRGTVNGLDNVGVQMGTFGEGAVEGHETNFGTHGGLGKLGDRELCVLDAVGGLVGVYNAKVEDTVQV
jgi:hypothetical protein